MKNSKYIKRAYNPMAIAAIFCAAAGVYANSGWSVSPDGSAINQAGTTSFNAPIKTGTWVDNGEITVQVNKVEITGQATITYDAQYNSNTQGIIFNETATDKALSIKSDAALKVESTEGSATAVIGAKEISSEGEISVNAKGDAVAISSNEAGKINVGKVSAISAEGNAIAIDVKNAERVDVKDAIGDVNVETAESVSVKKGQNINVGTVRELHVGDVENIAGKDVGGVYVNTAVNVSLDKAGEVVVHEAYDRVDIKEATGNVRVVEADMLSVKAGQNIDVTEAEQVHLGSVKDVVAGTVTEGIYIDTANDVSATNVKEFVAHNVNNVAVETADSLKVVNAKGNVSADSVAGLTDIGSAADITIGSASDVNIGKGADVNIGVANNVKVDSANSLNIADVKNVSANAVAGDATIGLNNGEMSADYVAGKLAVSGKGKVKVNEVGSLDAQADFGSFVAQENFVKLEGADMNIVGAGTTLNEAGEEISTAVNVAGDIKVQSATNVKLDGYKGNVEIGSSQDVTVVNGIDGDLTVGLSNGEMKADYVDGKLAVSGTGKVKVNEVGSLDAQANFDSFVAQENFVKLEGADMNIVGAGTTLNEAGEEISTAVNVASDIKVQSATNADINGYVGSVEIGKADTTIVAGGEKTNLTIGEATTSVEVKDSLASLNVAGTSGATVTAGEGAVITDLTVAGNLNVDVKEATNVTAKDVELAKVHGQEGVTFASANSGLNGRVENVSDSVTLNTKDVNSVVDVSFFEGKVTLDGSNGGNIAINSEKADVVVNVGADTKLHVENSKSVQVEGVEGAQVDIKTSNLDLVNKDESVTTTYQFKDKNGAEITSGIDLNDVSVATIVKDEAGNVTTGVTINATLQGAEKSVKLDTLDKDTALTFAGGNLTVDNTQGLDVKDVNDLAITTANGATNIGTPNAVTIETAGDAVEAGTVDGALKVTTGKDITIKTSVGSLDLGEVENVTVSEVVGATNIGTANAVTIETAGDAVEAGTVDGALKVTTGKDITINTSVGSLDLGEVENVTASEVAGATNIGTANAVDITKSVGTVDITKAKSLVIAEAQGNVTITEGINSVDVGLTNDADLLVKGKVATQARVNGGCDATFDGKVGNILVDNGLNGTLTINGGVENTIEAKNVEKIVFNNDNSVGGNVVLGGDAVIETTGSTTFKGNITADANLVLNGNQIVMSEQANSNKINVAGELSGSVAKSTVEKIYNDRHGILNADSVGVTTLVGTTSQYKDDAGNVVNVDDVKVGSFGIDNTFKNANGSIEGKFNTDGSYEITKNTYFQDNAQTQTEKAMGAVLDSISVSSDLDANKAAGDMKQGYYKNGLATAVPESVSNTVRGNMEIANMVHLDTLYRTSATRDMLNKFAKAKAAEADANKAAEMSVEGTTMVSLRNMNRVASYGSDSNASGSDHYVFGGLVNVDYIVNENLFFGAGIGGFESKINGRGAAGDADSESVVVSAYGDYVFAENFDWYFGATYSFNMNEAERTDSTGGIAKQDWDSQTIGLFTGVRYTWKPIADTEFYVKPLVGVNASFVLGEDSTSRGQADAINTEIDDYTSFKSVLGVEATYDFSNGFFLSGRILYTHEFADDSYDFDATFMQGPTSFGSFRVRGNEVDRDACIMSVGTGYSFNENWSAYFDYSAEITSDVFHNINLGVQYKF